MRRDRPLQARWLSRTAERPGCRRCVEKGVTLSRKTPHLSIAPLRNMVAVGRVSPYFVRLWLRSERSGDLGLRWWQEDDEQNHTEVTVHVPKRNAHDNTMSVVLPDDFPPVSPLMPLCRYRFRVVHRVDKRVLGEGRFETAPACPEDTPPHFSIALMSCHEPFTHRGIPRRSSFHMLRAARRCLQRHNTKLLFTVGDADPAKASHCHPGQPGVCCGTPFARS